LASTEKGSDNKSKKKKMEGNHFSVGRLVIRNAYMSEPFR